MLFLFWPIGLMMLIGKLRSTARYIGDARTAARNKAQRQSNEAPGAVEAEIRVRAAEAQAKPLAKSPAKKAKKATTADVNKGDETSGTAATQLEKERKTAKLFTLLLTIAAAVAIVGGGAMLIETISDISLGSPFWWWELLKSAFYPLGGLLVLSVRGVLSRRVRLRQRYLAKLGDQRSMSIAEFASALGVSAGRARRDIQSMIDDGYFGSGAYIDARQNELVLSSADASAAGAAKARTPESEQAARAEISEFDRVISELRSLNAKITDNGISYKIERIEAACAKIFAAVLEDPEKLPQIRRFMSYYLPTTLKLLRAYATLERQGIRGDNISSTKQSIDNVLDNLVIGFERQLDRLFHSDAIDISSDIEVLEGMLARDGLSEASPFKSQTSTGEII
jgi:DNA-binding Lrp family transcriptional regulator